MRHPHISLFQRAVAILSWHAIRKGIARHLRAVIAARGAGSFQGSAFAKAARKKRWFLIVVILVCGGLGLYGCVGTAGNFRNLSTPPGTYSVTITATSGTVQHSMPVTLVVQP